MAIRRAGCTGAHGGIHRIDAARYFDDALPVI
jgi:hypothetical protein